MDRRRAAGALLALAACIASATAAPTASNQTALDLYDADSAEGCYYNFQHYGEGDRIMTNEPCLNCTCHNRMLMCYLRVCPFTKPIGQDCTVEKRADQCCPIVTCPDVPVDLLTSTPTTSPAEYGTTGVGRLDKYGCTINGKYFPEGSKVPQSPNKPCEHCYCIRNMTTCVMQECTLHVDGCTPIYFKEVCCPIRYSCDHQDDEVPMLDDMTTTVRPTPGFLLTTTTVASVTQIPQECVHEDQIFPDGALIKTEKACEHCYCMKGDIVCVVQECGTPMENEGKNCTSLAPREGQCCPDTYICEGDVAPTDIPSEILPTEAPTEEPKEKINEAPTEQATEGQKGSPTNVPIEEATEYHKESSTDEPIEITTQVPAEDLADVQKELVTKLPEDIATEILTEYTTEEQKPATGAPTEEPKEDATEVLIEQTTEGNKEPTTNKPTEQATEVLRESSPETPIQKSTEVQHELQTEKSQEATTLVASEEVTEQQKESVTKMPTEIATEVPTDTATEAQKEVTTETPKEIGTDSDIGTTSQTDSASLSETSTEGVGEPLTDSDGGDDLPAQATELPVTEEETHATSEVTTTEEPIHPSSEVAPGEPTEELTTFIPPRRTSVEGSGYRNEPDDLSTESPFQETEGSGDEEKIEKPSDGEYTSMPIEETTSPVRDMQSEVYAADNLSTFSPRSTEPNLLYTEPATTEPDKGENTVPSDDIHPEIFDVSTSEASEATQDSEGTTPIIERKTEVPSEDKEGELSSGTTSEATTAEYTETAILSTKPVQEVEKATVSPAEGPTIKETEEITTETSTAPEIIAPTTEKEELEIQTTLSFDEKESKSTTVQLPDTPALGETIKEQETTTEIVQEYTTSENKIITDHNLFTTVLPEIEETKATTPEEISETSSINPLENEIHEDGLPSLTPGIIPGEGNCLVDGITYNNESIVPTSHKCQSSCKCVSSIVKCEEIMCSPQPENMGNCQAIYESEETCCPYYTCDQGKETPALKPHSQMSGTELPTTQSDCDGETCNKLDEGKPTPVAPLCTSGDCSSEIDNKNSELCGTAGCADQQKPILVPTKEDNFIQPEICSDGKCPSPPKDCTGDSCQLPTRKDCKDGTCDVSPQETCDGPNCGIQVTPVNEVPAQESTQGCANPEECKSSSSDSGIPTCVGEDCLLTKQDCSSGKCENIPVEGPSTPAVEQQEVCSSGKCESIPVEVPSTLQPEDCSSGKCESIPVVVPSIPVVQQQEDCSSGKCESIPVEVPPTPAVQEEEDCSSGKCESIPVEVPSTPAVQQQENCDSGKCESIPVEVPSTLQPEDCSSGKCESIPVVVPSIPTVQQQEDCSSGKCESIPVEVPSTLQPEDCTSGKCESIPVEVPSTLQPEDCSSGKCESIPVVVPSIPAVQQQEDCSSGKCESIPVEVPSTIQPEDCSSGKCESIPVVVPSTPAVQQQEDCSSGKCESIPVEVPSTQQPEDCSSGKCESIPVEVPSTKQPEDCSSGKCDGIPVEVPSTPAVQQQEDCSSGKCESVPVIVPSIPAVQQQEDCSSGKCESIPVEVPSTLQPEDCSSGKCESIPVVVPPTPAVQQQEDCSSGKCESIPVEVPSIPAVQPQEDCSSGKCESIPVGVSTTPELPQQEACSEENGCKKPDQSQKPQVECTDEACIKKDVTDIEKQPSPTCTDELCMHQPTTLPSSQVGKLSTELPESVDKLQTELPAIDTETEMEVTSDIPVTEPVEIGTTTQPATPKQEITIEISEPSTVVQETASQVTEMSVTELQELVPEVTHLPKTQEIAPTTATPLTEPEENKQPATEYSISELPESLSTEKTQSEITTIVVESEEPEEATHRQDIVTETSTKPSIIETPTKEDEEPIESDVTQSSLVTEGQEINTALPESLPTQSFKEPEVTESSKEPSDTELQGVEQSMAEEPAATEVLQESPTTEALNDFVTSEDDSKIPEISQMPEDQLGNTELPEQDTEIPETVTEDEIEQPIQHDLATERPDRETTTIPLTSEQAINTEGPQEHITVLPIVPIMDDKDQTESPQDVINATPEQPTSQNKDTSTEVHESYTTETYDIYTKETEIPLSEEQVKKTVAPEAPLTESQDDKTILGETTTPSVYSVTGLVDGLRDGAITEKEVLPTDSSTLNPIETSPSNKHEKTPEQPTTENQEMATETMQDKTTIQPESPVTEIEGIATKVPKPTSPITEQEEVTKYKPEATDSEEKQTVAPITSIPESETISTETLTEQDSATNVPTEPQETVTIGSDHLEGENATESIVVLPQDTEKPHINTEIPEILYTEPQKTSTYFPAITTSHEYEVKTEIPELPTEPQEAFTEASVATSAYEGETPVTQQQEIVTRVPEEATRITTETQDYATKAPKYTTKIPETDEQQNNVQSDTEQPSYAKPTEVSEVDTKAPEEQYVQTEVPLEPVTESQEIITPSGIEHETKQNQFESMTEPSESVTDAVESVTYGEEKRTENPEILPTEPQDISVTTPAYLSEQDAHTDEPGVGTKQDASRPEVAQPEESEQTRTTEPPVTELQEMATKVPVTEYSGEHDVTSESLPIETHAATEASVTMTIPEMLSSEPEPPVSEAQEIATEQPQTPIIEEQDAQTNIPEMLATETQYSTPSPGTEIPHDATVQEDIGKPTLAPESHVTEYQQVITAKPELQELQTVAPVPSIDEPEETSNNVPVILVPGEQSTAQEPATYAPEAPIQEEHTELPIEQPLDSGVTVKTSIPEEKLTESPERDSTEPSHIITDSPTPGVTEKPDVKFTATETTGGLDERISSSEAPITETSQPKLEYSDTTPYLVELEEHTHKIEVETSTIVLEDVSMPQTTEEYEKPKEPLEKQTEIPSNTEKSIEISTTLQEAIPTGSLSTLSTEEQTTSKNDVDDTRRTTISSEELEDKVPEEAVPVPEHPVTDQKVEPTAQPELETDKYTSAQPTEKPVEMTASQEVSSEEDLIPFGTTTIKSADDATTFAPSDKATTQEPKPTEAASPTSQDTAKPTSSEEVAPEEDAGQFPPSGTGYGQEPDYAEEDQAFGPGTCRYGGKVYVSAQQIPRDDPCDFCFCFRSDIICLQQSCPPPIHGCHEEPIQGFCCPRYECPVSMATTLNMTTTTTTTTTTLPPHFLTHAYNGAAQKRGCLIKGHTYKVGEVVRASSGPCLHCTCGGDGQMKCDPKVCTPEPMLRQMIAAAVSAKRRR